MEEISNKLKTLIGNLSEILVAAIGLLVSRKLSSARGKS